MGRPIVVPVENVRRDPSVLHRNAAQGCVITNHGRLVALVTEVTSVDQARDFHATLVDIGLCNATHTEWTLSFETYHDLMESHPEFVLRETQLVIVAGEDESNFVITPLVKDVESVILLEMAEDVWSHGTAASGVSVDALLRELTSEE